MNLLEYLEKKAKLSGDICISYDELAEWSAEQIEQAKQLGCLVQTDDAEEIICRECPKRCSKEIEIRQKEDQSVGVYFCEDEDCAGLIQIDLKRLQQWQINKKKLSQLGYGKKRVKRGEGYNRREKKQNEKLQLLTALLQHHGFDSDEINYTPANQKDLRKLINWSQPKVHRVMKTIFGNSPMSSYKARCKQKTIIGFLNKNEDGSYTPEAIAPHNEE